MEGFIKIIKEIEDDMEGIWNFSKEFQPTYTDFMHIGVECRKLYKFDYARYCYDLAVKWVENEYLNYRFDNAEVFIDENGDEYFSEVYDLNAINKLKSGALSAKANAFICEAVQGKPTLTEYIECMENAIVLCDNAIALNNENEEANSNKNVAISNIKYGTEQFLKDIGYFK